MFGPHGEIVRISRKLLLQTFHHRLVFEKQHAGRRRFEHIQFVFRGLEAFRRHDFAQFVQRDVPQFFVFRTKQHHHAR